MINELLKEQGLTLVRLISSDDDLTFVVAIDPGGMYRTLEVRRLFDEETNQHYLEIVD
jgi:hypothetical protein